MPTPATVTGNFQDATGADPQAAYVRFRLRGYSGFVVRVLGTTTVIEPQIDVPVDPVTGNISVAIWGNDNIDPANTWWTIEYFSSGRVVFSGNYLITGSSFNLNTAPIINPPAVGSAQTVQGVPQYTLLKTEGVPNSNQAQLDLHGAGGIVVSNVAGVTTLTGSGGSSALQTVKLTFSAADIHNGGVTKTLVAAPGANKAIFPVQTFFIYKKGTQAFSGYTLRIGTFDSPYNVITSITAPGWIDQVVHDAFLFAPGQLFSDIRDPEVETLAFVENEAMILNISSGSNNGDGTVIAVVSYYVVDWN